MSSRRGRPFSVPVEHRSIPARDQPLPWSDVATPTLHLSREQILAHRRRVTALDHRLAPGAESLHRAAWAGLSDSAPRAALLSIHARVESTWPRAWEHESLVQLWGPRFSVYVVAAVDRAVFTLGRTSEGSRHWQLGEDIADRLEAALGSDRALVPEAARAAGLGHHNALRYAAPTGRLLVRWDGARTPHVWVVPRPEMTPMDARLELARRFLTVYGAGDEKAYGAWAGIRTRPASATFEALRSELTPVTTPGGRRAWILAEHEGALREPSSDPAPARLLPGGDTYYLLQGADRELLVPEADHRSLLWPTRVWPGALLVDGEVVGVWRRAQHVVTAQAWTKLSAAQHAAVEAEATALPLPGLDRDILLRWEDL